MYQHRMIDGRHGEMNMVYEKAPLCRRPRLKRSQTAASDIYRHTSAFMLSARIPVHASLRFVGKEPETPCLVSPSGMSEVWTGQRDYPCQHLLAGAHAPALLLQQPPRKLSRLASRLPWFDSVFHSPCVVYRLTSTLHRLASSFVEPKGNQQVQAGGRHVELRQGQGCLLDLSWCSTSWLTHTRG